MSTALRAAAVNSADLREHLAHAARLARTIEVLAERAFEDDPAFAWLTGRASEVRAFVGDVAREWMIGGRDEGSACRAIASYLESLHRGMQPWFGEWYAPSCCGPYSHEEPASGRRPVASPIEATLSDTITKTHDSASHARPIKRARR